MTIDWLSIDCVQVLVNTNKNFNTHFQNTYLQFEQLDLIGFGSY